MLAFTRKLREPVITDRSVDLLAISAWLLFAGWGLASTITGLPTITENAPPWYVTVWGATIGLLGFLGAVAGVLTFIDTPNLTRSMRFKTAEMMAVASLGVFIAIYPVYVIILVCGGDLTRFSTIFASLVYLLIPAWRSRNLYMRIRVLRTATGEVR